MEKLKEIELKAHHLGLTVEEYLDQWLKWRVQIDEIKGGQGMKDEIIDYLMYQHPIVEEGRECPNTRRYKKGYGTAKRFYSYRTMQDISGCIY